MRRTFSTTLSQLRFRGPLANILISPCDERVGFFSASGLDTPAPQTAIALIDTGADFTAVPEELAVRAGAKPHRVRPLTTFDGPAGRYRTYLVKVVFPRGDRPSLEVEAVGLTDPSAECLIGRDVLEKAVFVYDGPNETYRLTI